MCHCTWCGAGCVAVGFCSQRLECPAIPCYPALSRFIPNRGVPASVALHLMCVVSIHLPAHRTKPQFFGAWIRPRVLTNLQGMSHVRGRLQAPAIGQLVHMLKEALHAPVHVGPFLVHVPPHHLQECDQALDVLQRWDAAVGIVWVAAVGVLHAGQQLNVRRCNPFTRARHNALVLAGVVHAFNHRFSEEEVMCMQSRGMRL